MPTGHIKYLYKYMDLIRTSSFTISNQGNEGTCFAHAVSRVFLKAMRNYIPELKINIKKDCNDFYNIRNMKRLLYNYENFEKCTENNKNNVVIYIFLYAIIVDKFGCNGGNTYESINYVNNFLIKILKIQEEPMPQIREESIIMDNYLPRNPIIQFGGTKPDIIYDIMSKFFKHYNAKENIQNFENICIKIYKLINKFFENFYKLGNDFEYIYININNLKSLHISTSTEYLFI